jgi:hypothetical protein
LARKTKQIARTLPSKESWKRFLTK